MEKRGDTIIETTAEARQGEATGRMRRVLGTSFVSAIVVLGIIVLIWVSAA